MTSLNTISRVVVGDNEPFRAYGPVPHGGEHALNGVGRAQVIPMLSRKVVEGQQCVAIIDQAFDRPTVFGAVFLGKDVDRRFGGRPVWRPIESRADPSS
jgi:hypothetical protein